MRNLYACFLNQVLPITIFFSSTLLCCQQNEKIPSLGTNNVLEVITGETETSTIEIDYYGQKGPGKKPELFVPGIFSTLKEHSSPMFTPDGSEIWFGRMYPSRLWMAKKSSGKWTHPFNAPLDTAYHYLYPFLSPDGNKVFFTSDMPVKPGKKKLERGDGDIWYIERQNGKWSQPIHMGYDFNFGIRHAIGSISNKGNIFYTVRTGNRYKHSTDIYMSQYEDGGYLKPVAMDELNSDEPVHSPFMDPEERFILIATFHHSLGLSDLSISFPGKDGKWTAPKNLGKNINTAAKEEYPYISPDEKYLFFNSNRPSPLNTRRISNGPGNMFWVDAKFIFELLKDWESGQRN